MKNSRWIWVLALTLAFAAESRAQFFAPFPVGGFGYGGVGFGFQRRNFAIGGFFGGGYSGFAPYGFGPGVYPFSPYGGFGYNRVTIITPPPVIVQGARARRRAQPEEEYDLAGVDLDLVRPDDLLKSREELERIMDQAKARPVVKKRIAPPADVPPPPKKKPAPPPPEIKKPPAPPERLPEYQRLLESGLDAFGRQLYGVAISRFRQAVKLDAAKARGHFLLSQADFALAKYAEAAAAVRAGMRLQKDWPLVKFDPRLDLYKGSLDFDLHLKTLEEVQAANPKNADYLFLLAHELWFTGRRERAVELFRRARPLAADPSFIDAFLRAAPPGPVAVK